jgi:aldose 1-epimerase
MTESFYAARRGIDHGIETVHLACASDDINVSIVPSIGNRGYEMLVHGQNILHFPHAGAAELKSDRHLSGIPFLAPWANRMPEGFHANGKNYKFPAESGALRLDANGIPIHGLLSSSPFWEVTDLGADEKSAHVTSRLEFWRHPDLMAVWPFAHTYEMTYRLSAGAVEVSLAIENLSSDAMPVAVGFHPYFRLPGVRIADAVARIPVNRHVDTDSRLVPTGDTTAVDFDEVAPLRNRGFDDGFTGLKRNADGRTVFSVEGEGKKIEVTFGARYPVAIVYAPAGENFICFEPMSAVTNGINLAAEGKYPELQWVAPGGQWRESFWIRATGL